MNNIDCLNILYNFILMLEDRGYTYLGTNYEKIKMDKNKIENNVNVKDFEISDYTYVFNNFKYHLLFKKRSFDSYVIIFFLDSFLGYDNNVNNAMKNYYSYFYKYSKTTIFNKTKHIYLACSEKYEQNIKKRIVKDEYFTETLKYKLYNPTQHEYFPKHERIKNYEKKYKKFNLKLPIILKNDVATTWHDFEIDDIIKVGNKNIYYRIVKEEKN